MPVKKLLSAGLLLCLLAAAATVGVVRYVKPQEPLDLSYAELPLKEKAASMVRQRQFSVELTSAEVNDLLKKALAAGPEVRPGVVVTGARFSLQGEQLTADVHVRLRERWDAAAALQFDLSWEEPYLTAVHTGTRVRSQEVPASWFRLEPLQVPLNDYLPRHVAIRDLVFGGSAVQVQLKLQ